MLGRVIDFGGLELGLRDYNNPSTTERLKTRKGVFSAKSIRAFTALKIEASENTTDSSPEGIRAAALRSATKFRLNKQIAKRITNHHGAGNMSRLVAARVANRSGAANVIG